LHGGGDVKSPGLAPKTDRLGGLTEFAL
jgi:hypothetical protein